MSTAILNQLLDDIAPEERASFKSVYQRIKELPSAATDLQDFLDEYLRHVVQLYAATAGAIWFCSPSGGNLGIKAHIGLDHLGLEGEYQTPHEQLLKHALGSARAYLVRPFSTPGDGANVSNPTDSFLLLGPIDSQGEPIGVVELFLGPTPPRGQTSGDRNRFVLWLDHLVEHLRQGIRLRYLGSSAPLQPAMINLEAARAEIGAYKEAIRKSLEVTLNSYVGWNFGSLQNNQTFAKTMHILLDENGLRVACAECGAPAILRCQAAGNSKTGVFLYDHYLETGRTFHGGPSTFPRVTLIGKPPRRKSR
jgi:predicted RNA-binding Zn-ribbon protein involved in translation (DUF1610 family)